MKNEQTNLGFVFTVGLLVGYVASLIIPERAQEKAKEQLGESVNKLKDSMADFEPLEKVRSAVSGAAPDLMSLYMDGRQRVMEELTNAQESWDTVNKRKYGEVMKKVLDGLVEENKVPSQQLKTLQQYLESDFQTFRSTKKTA